MLNFSPADMVASRMNDGKGTKGISEAKKLIRANPKYPISLANGKIADKSTTLKISNDY